MAHPWKCLRMDSGAAWSGGKCPFSWQGVGTRWSVRSLPTQTQNTLWSHSARSMWERSVKGAHCPGSGSSVWAASAQSQLSSLKEGSLVQGCSVTAYTPPVQALPGLCPFIPGEKPLNNPSTNMWEMHTLSPHSQQLIWVLLKNKYLQPDQFMNLKYITGIFTPGCCFFHCCFLEAIWPLPK